jgi:hypothetical protein
MRELLLVLNVKAASFLKQVFRLNWQTFFKNLSSVLIFGGFAVAMFFLSPPASSYRPVFVPSFPFDAAVCFLHNR